MSFAFWYKGMLYTSTCGKTRRYIDFRPIEQKWAFAIRLASASSPEGDVWAVFKVRELSSQAFPEYVGYGTMQIVIANITARQIYMP